MRLSRLIALVVIFAVAALASWWLVSQRGRHGGDTITVYYTKLDGTSEVPWRVTLGPARDAKSVAFYAAAQALAGPAAGIDAVRFPNGTHVRAVDVQGSTVDVDISSEVGRSAEGGFAETAEFKALVWTLTDPNTLPGVAAVRIRVDGARVATLPGGHFELDEPLTRASF